MTDERQPRERPSAATERDAAPGALVGDGTAAAASIRGGALVVTLLAPADRPPIAVTTRRADDGAIVVVLQRTIALGTPAPHVPWSYVLPVPPACEHATTARITGLGAATDLPLDADVGEG